MLKFKAHYFKTDIFDDVFKTYIIFNNEIS